jgi:hypothetical protein
MAKKKTSSSKKKTLPKPKAVSQIPLVQSTVSARPTLEFLTANVPAHVHGNFVPPTPSEKKLSPPTASNITGSSINVGSQVH